MAQPQVFEGTAEEFASRLGEFAGMRLKVFAAPEEEEQFGDDLPDPPNTVRDQAHLQALLLEGINAPKQPVTEQEWTDIRQEVRRRGVQSRQIG